MWRTSWSETNVTWGRRERWRLGRGWVRLVSACPNGFIIWLNFPQKAHRDQWQFKDFPDDGWGGGGRLAWDANRFDKIFPENCMKIKEIGPREGACIHSPLWFAHGNFEKKPPCPLRNPLKLPMICSQSRLSGDSHQWAMFVLKLLVEYSKHKIPAMALILIIRAH